MIEQLLFWVFAILACGGAVAVVATHNVVRMAFWLVVSLGSVAALFFLLHADFLGAAQLLIYVGGTVVLLVFGVMLTASGPYNAIPTSPAEGIVGGAVGFLLLFVLVSSIGSVDWTGSSFSRRYDFGRKSGRIVCEYGISSGQGRICRDATAGSNCPSTGVRIFGFAT